MKRFVRQTYSLFYYTVRFYIWFVVSFIMLDLSRVLSMLIGIFCPSRLWSLLFPILCKYNVYRYSRDLLQVTGATITSADKISAPLITIIYSKSKILKEKVVKRKIQLILNIRSLSCFKYNKQLKYFSSYLIYYSFLFNEIKNTYVIIYLLTRKFLSLYRLT